MSTEQRAAAYLRLVGVTDLGVPPTGPDLPPSVAWARSGAMWLTGLPEGRPLLAPGDPAGRVRALGAAITALAPTTAPALADPPALLGERAALLGLRRQGTANCGGSARLLPAGDGWLCVNLPRPDDWDLVPAWLEVDPTVAPEGDWDGLTAAVATRPVRATVERGRLLGLPVTELGPPVARPPLSFAPGGTDRGRVPRRLGVDGTAPLVVDLSALWAGPLCTQLLAAAGCRVVKVEAPDRLDGTRRGPRAFFDLMHHGKESVVADLRSPEVAALLAEADVVVTAARARALRPLGLFPPPAPVWVAISGYGHRDRGTDAVAFGDDATVAAGLVARDDDRPDGRPLFCGDALADPVAGLLAALGALALLRDGRPGRVGVALRDAAGHLHDPGRRPDHDPGRPPDATRPGEVAPPRARALGELPVPRR
jgi:hypothetical protein